MPSTVDEGIPAKLAHRRTPTANDFPVPIGHTPSAGKRDQGLISPTQSSFTFTDEDLYPHAISTPCTMPSSPITRDFDRGTPGEGGSRATSVNGYTEQKELGRKRSQHYADTLTVREPLMSARDRVHKDSVIMAEVKTNVIIRDEFLFLSELSQHLSQRYQRPTSSIFITLDHSACLLFAGSFESAYILTITALPSQVTPTTNKRNTALTQSFMSSSLGVLPDRGVVKFIGIPDEYLAISGTTILGQIERLHKNTTTINNITTSTLPTTNGEANPPQRTSSKRATQRKPPALSLVPRSQSTPGSRMPSPTLTHETPTIPAIPKAQSVIDRKASKMQRVGKRKSFMAIFGR